MRVTQSMLSSNMLRNLSNSYGKMSALQDQINTGKKITRPSQDPVVATKGIGYRTDLSKVEQYQRNIGEVNNWLDSSDDALDHVGQAVIRLQELVTQAATDSNTSDDRKKILVEITQMRQQIQDLGNTKVGDKYIFSGTNTLTPLHGENGFAEPSVYSGLTKDVKIEVYDGVELKVNTNGHELFKGIDDMLANIEKVLGDGSTGTDISGFLTEISNKQNSVLEKRADIGARQNRVEMMDNRLASQEIIATKRMSENEDIDYEEAITDMVTQESIHNAALSIGSKIIQATLVDFLR
ncbi:flagellar hook-associated protein 3 FlgL [Psychrobacillus psychrotolerans]|uniref:Flagellar hook-associated protein 3 FlgL n=1 Tax=Psychrobacillus psychrotolerans TaxID=126156 RepID=A0A1I5ZAC8_9BACI|nr:flagellar hook-associated protein FlgL [Psychrobacillus psychrotolerans]SFQ53430.1 flagellar hook-associated protein 3 FlgL [Psychrobacillus psychrotolerans]